MHNEHYNQLEIDTIALWKANKTLKQLIDACEFQIDKYNRRPKKGEELKDCNKIIYYASLKWECYDMLKECKKNITYNKAIEFLNKKNNNTLDFNKCSVTR